MSVRILKFHQLNEICPEDVVEADDDEEVGETAAECILVVLVDVKESGSTRVKLVE